MSDNEKMKFLDKIKDAYNYDNGYIFGFIGKGSEHYIVKNYVAFEDRLEAYNLEDKINFR